MHPTDDSTLERLSLDDAIERFEARWSFDGDRFLTYFLPEQTDPNFEDFAIELLRVDMEYRWKYGEPKTVEEYQRKYAALLERPHILERLAFEEYRQRRKRDEDVDPEEFTRRFQVRTDHWPKRDSNFESTTYLAQEAFSSGIAEEMKRIVGVTQDFPEKGDQFFDFSIVKVLAKCRFGRVYLAKQNDLANRHVIIKLTSNLWCEADRLARLQHANIVPIYSVHQQDGLQAVCMPFLGSHTLQDWIRFARTKRSVSGAEFLRFLSAKIDDENEIFSGETPSDHRTFLANLTFEHLCVWILSQVADGLIHAHERGILHRDLKPSNILVTDEGQPLILDFNLSEDANAGQAFVLIGGTLEYMAPEHLKAVVAEGRMDVRSDIYSLGVILFQLLTGELPFPVREGSIIENLNFLINDRSRSIPSCRVFHSKISHDMESIVQRCLAAEPTARYQSTREFKSDLDRHLHNLPLRYAKNRSLRERARKWSKRHSKLKMALCFSAALTVILVLFSLRGQKIAKQNAIDLFHQFEMQRHAAVGPLSLPKISDVETEAALVAARDALAYYGFQEPHRKLSVEFRRLDSERQMKVLRWSRELLFLMAQSELKNRYSVQDEILNDEDREYLQRSLYQNELANKLIQDERQSTAVQLQRAEILRRLKQGTNEQLEVPFEIPPNDPAPYLAAVWLSSKGRYHQARPILEELQAEQPSNYFVALLLGYCCYDQHEYFQAEAYFTSCIAFRPDFHVPYLWRGINRMKMLRYEEAESDFCSVIKLKPQHTSGLANRAICYKLLKRYREAANDLTRMIEVGRTDSMPYLLRADVWRLLDETEKAKQDLAEGLNRSPIDSDGWNQRAIAWLPGKPENALADLDEALRLQPHYQKVLRNKAHVLSHYLKRHDEAIEVLGQVLSNDPMDSTALFGRGLLYARQGRRDDAIQDGRNALKAAESKKREPSAQIHYHVAQIFSLTSQLVPADAQEAVDLLRIALKGDIRLSRYLATDGALQPIADREDFKRLVTTVSW